MPKLERNVYWDDGGASTRVRARFHGESGHAYSGVVDGYRPQFGTIIGFSSSKNKSSPSGTWALTVKRPDTMTHEKWMATLWPDPEGTWVELDWICNGQTISGMLGNIDTVSHNTSADGSGAVSTIYTIAGRDHGKVFEQTVCWINIFDGGGVLNNAAMYATMEAFLGGTGVGGTPAYYVRGLIEAWIGNYNLTEPQWTMPQSLGGMPFYKMIDLSNIALMAPADGNLIDATVINIATSGSTLWSTIMDYANVILNEVIVDLAPPRGVPASLSGWKPSICLRRMPFATRSDRTSWDMLRTRTLDPSDIKAESTTRGGAENRFNYWQLRLEPEGHDTDAIVQTESGSPGIPGSNPIWSIDSIRKHGLRRWTQATKYLQMDNEGYRPTLADLASQWLLLCHDWYVVSPYQRTGTITTTRAFPEIRVGEKLRANREGRSSYIDYYVEAVSNTWVHGEAGATTVTVSRGEENREDHLAYAYAQLGYAAQKTAFIASNPYTTPGAAPGAPATLDQVIAAASDALATPETLVEEQENPPPLAAESSEADFNAVQPTPSDPEMVNTLPPPSITTANAAIAYDDSGGTTEPPNQVSPEPGELSPAMPTQTNVEDGRPIFIELDLEEQIGPGSAVVVMGSDGLPVESED